MEHTQGQMLDAIRRIYENIYLLGNYQAAVKMATSALGSRGTDRHGSLTSETSPTTFAECSTAPSDRLSGSLVQSGGSCTSSLASSRLSKGSSVLSNSVIGALDSGYRIKDDGPPLTLNRLQEFHLLLLRAEGYGALKCHEKALKDAEAAIKISGGRSAEAHFVLGRELLHLCHLEESVAAFQTAELLLAGLAADGVPFPEEVSDKEFWEQRGYALQDVDKLRLKRPELEVEEQLRYGRRVVECSTLSSSGGAEQKLLSIPLVVRDVKCGYPTLTKWRQLSREAAAVLTAYNSHVFPVSYLNPTIAFMERNMSLVRNGVVVCIQNTTSFTFKWVGCWFPDCTFNKNISFPQTIKPGQCAIALIQPRGWGGYVGYVCYQVAEGGVCCFFCLESSFMGSIRCGVLFSPPEEGRYDGKESDDDVALKGFMSFNMPNSSAWLATHATPPTASRRLKAWINMTEGGRSSVFTVAEVSPMRLRTIELLTALEFAGPALLKKLSIVSHRYRAIVNTLPPPMFYSPGRVSYPDYCLRCDRLQSPWVVCDRETVKWVFVMEGCVGGRESCVVADSGHVSNAILRFSREKGNFMDAKVYYGNKGSLIALIKGSRMPFNTTLSFITAAGRTFATCYLNHNSQLTVSWGSAGSKNKPEDVEYVMTRRDLRDNSCKWRSNLAPNRLVESCGSADAACAKHRSGQSPSQVITSAAAPNTGAKTNVVEAYVVSRVSRGGGDSGADASSPNSGGGAGAVGEVVINTARGNTQVKGAAICDLHLHYGVDALLLSLMAYCRLNWDQ
uniref:Uncharacterized protein n=1 Tax=Trypanosoma congolense (strain IL3000) TaxID=1068625 RepID=G0UZ77_TRYCI|nr:conserved hypothetical protein [Trypanosoma congolense IL3000]